MIIPARTQRVYYSGAGDLLAEVKAITGDKGE
jgi:hypothetical protein